MKQKLTIRQMSVYALLTALMCVLGPISVPIGPVPVSLGTFVIYLSTYLLGGRGAAISCAAYLLLGLCGLPVFTQYQGGLGKVVGPTGGYMVGYLFVALIGGFFITRYARKTWLAALGLILGTAVLYTFGTAWFMILTKCALWYALTQCVAPFVAFDLIKIALAIGLGKVLVNGLTKARLL